MNTTSVAVPFRRIHTSKRTGPLCWAQRAMWEVITWLPEGDTSLNLGKRVNVPAGLSLNTVLEAVATLMGRHDSLHTGYMATGEGPEQHVTHEGEQPVIVHDSKGQWTEPEVATLHEELLDGPFPPANWQQLRIAVLTHRSSPHHILLAISHLALDAWSLDIVVGELQSMLVPDPLPLPPTAQQPLDRAAFEATPRGQALNEATLAYWSGIVRSAPRSMLEQAAEPHAAAWARLTSGELASALLQLADQNRTTASLVLLTSVARLLGQITHQSEAVLRLIVATRFRPESRELVGAFNQNAVFRLPLADSDFADLLRQGSRAAMKAYRNCECDPVALEEAIAAIAYDRGFEADGYCFFNDVSQMARPAAHAPQALDWNSPTLVGEFQSPVVPKGAKFFLNVQQTSAPCQLTLYADRAFIAPYDPVSVLQELVRQIATEAKVAIES